MDLIQPRTKEIRIRNVAYISNESGKDDGTNSQKLQAEPVKYGTLILQRHHMVFAYVPAIPPQQTSAPSTPRVSRESSEVTSASKASGLRPRKRELWTPYPLINQCVLRPSHAQGTRVQDLEICRHSDGPDDDSAFPPVYGTSASARPSTDSLRPVRYTTPYRSDSPAGNESTSRSTRSGSRNSQIRIGTRDFKQMVLIFHGDATRSSDTAAREVFYCLRNRCCVDRVQDLFAFHFKPPHEEIAVATTAYDARREFARMGIGGKAAEGPGSAWRITNINQDYTFSPTYPNILCVPAAVSDNMLKYGGPYRSKSRIPALTYLHSNSGSITRSSQPMPGLGGKRNPQDERLVSAIFSSHTTLEHSTPNSPPKEASHGAPVLENGDGLGSNTHNSVDPIQDLSETLDNGSYSVVEGTATREVIPRQKVYGSTRKMFIVDARPKLNALANRATGGGIEDVSNYCGPSGDPPERLFLDIANIHVMRKSLAKVVESFGSAEVSSLGPMPKQLQESGWLGHIAGLLDGSEKVARAVGLGGDHVLLHCSDGWDRTSQVAAIAQVMLDPYYRTIVGFITLIQKDFLSFGHKFNHRHGILGCEKWFDIENERVIPANARDNGGTDSNFGSKALSGARNWLEKNRNGLFGQQNDGRGTPEGSPSRPPSPPANPVLHAPATSSTSKDREHKVKEDEIAPIFHQFLDAIFQLQHEYPSAFEFNAKFLERLLYHTYSCQYGEFLFNNERERSAEEPRFPSVWPHFVARQQGFVNAEYAVNTGDPLLFPLRSSTGGNIKVRWWSQVFRRKDEDMNTPLTLFLPASSENRQHLSAWNERLSTSTHEVPNHRSMDAASDDGGSTPARKVPSVSDMRNTLSATFASLQMGGNGQQAKKSSAAEPVLRPTLEQRETDTDILAGYARSAEGESATSLAADARTSPEVEKTVPVAQPSENRLDFAAFAQGSAYSDR